MNISCFKDSITVNNIEKSICLGFSNLKQLFILNSFHRALILFINRGKIMAQNIRVFIDCFPQVKNQFVWHHYWNFIEKHLNDEFKEGDYTEVHHICPKCYLDKQNWKNKNNLIRLEANDHFIAHKLLYLSLEGKMAFPFFRMISIKNKYSKNYSLAKLSFINEIKKIENFGKHSFTLEQKKRLSEAIKNYAASLSPEERSKQFGYWAGRQSPNKGKYTFVHKVIKPGQYIKKYIKKDDLDLYLSEGWIKGNRNSAEAIEKLKQCKTGKVFSESHCKNLSLSHLGKPSNRKNCILSKETKEKLSKYFNGTKWMHLVNNPNVKRLVRPEEFDKYIKLGYDFGEKPKEQLKRRKR